MIQEKDMKASERIGMRHIGLTILMGVSLFSCAGYEKINSNTIVKAQINQPKASITLTQQNALKMDAKQTLKPFVRQLMSTVKQSVKTSGHAKTVRVCKTLAPQITNQHQQTWQLKRTSEKLRNLKNAPDAWETAVLNEFSERIKAGEPAHTIEKGEVVGNEYRYMKAIAIQQPCMACHGNKVSPDVKDIIKKAYPKDKAIDYTLGDLRGAFSMTKQLNTH